jgi:DNA modification methylase
MGSLYRSKHELVFVYKAGTAPHLNTIELGKHGRYRTNVWDYAGVNTFRTGREAELEMHPTVKPTALVIDAIKDCSRRGEIVLDVFAGSGTTIMAAHKSRRRARAIELDPLYVDVAIRRWQSYKGEVARMAITGETFAEAEERRSDPLQ